MNIVFYISYFVWLEFVCLSYRLSIVSRCLVSLRVVRVVGPPTGVFCVQTLRYKLKILTHHLFFIFLNVIIQLLEGIGCCHLVLLYILWQTLKPIGQVFYVCPASISFSPFNLVDYRRVVSKVSIIQISVVPQKKTCEVQSQISFFLLVC